MAARVELGRVMEGAIERARKVVGGMGELYGNWSAAERRWLRGIDGTALGRRRSREGRREGKAHLQLGWAARWRKGSRGRLFIAGGGRGEACRGRRGGGAEATALLSGTVLGSTLLCAALAAAELVGASRCGVAGAERRDGSGSGAARHRARRWCEAACGAGKWARTGVGVRLWSDGTRWRSEESGLGAER